MLAGLRRSAVVSHQAAAVLHGPRPVCGRPRPRAGHVRGLLGPGDAVLAEKPREDAVRDEGWGVARWTWPDLSAGHRPAARIRRAPARGGR